MNAIDALPRQTASLVAAARRALWSDSVRPFATSQSDDEIEIDLAMRHGMLAWTPNVPADAQRAHAQQALRGIQQLREAAAALENARIPFVVFKGPALSQWLFGDPCGRRFSDVDLLVAADHRLVALGVLESLGYRRRISRGPDDIAHRWIGAWPMARAAGENVDLHWRLFGPRFGRFIDSATVVNESIALTVAGRAIRMPRPEHSAALLVVHSAKHLWYALEYVFALARMTRLAVVKWDEVYELLRAAGTINAAATGFALVKQLFDIDPPAAFQTALAHPEVETLRGLAMRSLALSPSVFPDRRLDRQLQRLSLDRRSDRVRYDLSRIFEPTQADCEWIELPESFGFLYWVLRPVRLAARGLLR